MTMRNTVALTRYLRRFSIAKVFESRPDLRPDCLYQPSTVGRHQGLLGWKIFNGIPSELVGVFSISNGVSQMMSFHSNESECGTSQISTIKTLLRQNAEVQDRVCSQVSKIRGIRWMRITGTWCGPLASPSIRNPFVEGGFRFKSKKKMKRAKAKRREVLSKIKRMRVFSKKRKEDMTPEERLEFRLVKGRRKMELIKIAISKFPVQEIPPEDPDIEVLTPEQLHYLKKIGYKNKNYVPVGRRGIYGGTVQNMHMHWKKHETVQVEIAGFTKEEVKVMADQLARLSGGLVIDIHQNNIVILYRGRNYKMPKVLIPMKTLDKRKALAKSVLEQSLKSLIENDEKLEKELAILRKDIEYRQFRSQKGTANEGIKDAHYQKLETDNRAEDSEETSDFSAIKTLDDEIGVVVISSSEDEDGEDSWGSEFNDEEDDWGSEITDEDGDVVSGNSDEDDVGSGDLGSDISEERDGDEDNDSPFESRDFSVSELSRLGSNFKP